MAEKRFDWALIRKEYDENKYKTLKKLAEAHGVSYTYMKKRSAKWKRENKVKDLVIENEMTFMQEEKHQTFIADINSIPEDRNEWHKRLWDKLGIAAEIALNNIEENFYTNDGKLKSKALSDVAVVLDKVQKGHQELKQENNNGQLQDYANFIVNLRATNVVSLKDKEDE